MTPNIKCPNCGSSRVRSRKMVYKCGTSNYSGSSSSSGMSFGLGKNFKPRFYSGGSRHSGTRQSLIAQDAAPFPVWVGLPLFVITYLLSGSGTVSVVIALTWTIFAIFVNNQTYEKEWICSKCGEKFAPEETIPVAIIDEIKTLLSIINSGETKQKRKNSAAKAIKLLDELERSGHSHTINNFDELNRKLPILLKSADALDLLDKAEYEHFIENKKKEIKYLLDALYSLRKNQVKVSQFNSLATKSEVTEEVWTVNLIKKKMLEAGYVSPKKGK